MISAFGIEHEISKREHLRYQNPALGDMHAHRTHNKQTVMNGLDGKPHYVDRKMKRTIKAMNKAGIDTKYSDTGDRGQRGYVAFNDRGNKRLKSVPKGFTRQRARSNDHNPEPQTIVRFSSGPVVGAVNRGRLRRAAAKDKGKGAKLS